MRQGSIYTIYPEVEGCASYGFDAYELMDYWDDYLAYYFKGAPLPKDWKMPKYSLGAPRKPLYDFVYGDTGAPIVSERVKDSLSLITSDAIQFWPVGKVKGQECFIFNVIRVLDCLDIKKSEISYSPSTPGKVLGINKAYFDYNKIPKDTVVFKVPQYPRPIYVTDAFVDCVRKHRLTGVGFEWPHDVGAARPKNVFPDLPFREQPKTKDVKASKGRQILQTFGNTPGVTDSQLVRDEDVFCNQSLGFRIVKPADWEFVPTEWTMSFRKRMDPDDQELKKIMTLARMPFVSFRYDHKSTDWAYPTVQITCRPLSDVSVQDHREEILKMQCQQMKKSYENINFIDINADVKISGFPASRIISEFSIYTGEGKEFKCLSQSYTVYVRKLGFTIGLSGPSEGPYQNREVFQTILDSVIIK